MPETDLSSEEERHIGFLISDVARLLRTAFDRRVKGLGLTRSQWLVINRLHRRPGATQSELAEMLEVEKATAGRMVDRMEKKGWVVRRPDAGDRRVNRLHLTAEADLIQVQLAPIAERTVDDALSLLSASEKDQFSEAMRRVKRRLQAMLEPDPERRPSDAPLAELVTVDSSSRPRRGGRNTLT